MPQIYLDEIAEDLAQLEPRLNEPKRRAKWASKVASKKRRCDAVTATASLARPLSSLPNAICAKFVAICRRARGWWVGGRKRASKRPVATHAYEGPHTDDAAAGLQVTAKVEERLPEPNSAPSDEAAATEAEEKNRKQAP